MEYQERLLLLAKEYGIEEELAVTEKVPVHSPVFAVSSHEGGNRVCGTRRPCSGLDSRLRGNDDADVDFPVTNWRLSP